MVRARATGHASVIVFLAIALVIIYAWYALSQPLPLVAPHVVLHYQRGAQPVALAWPSGGEAAVGAVGYGELAAHGAQTPRPTASIIKLLTALCVLNQRPITDGQGATIVLGAADVADYQAAVEAGGSVVRVTLGEQMSEYQALEALLLPSANNMADTLARWAFDSRDAFLTYANTYARAIGMTDTTVTDPSGFDPATVSTPHDLLLLATAALANPTIAAVARERLATIPVQGTVYNYNTLLGSDGVIGLKTGNNDADTGAFLFASQQMVEGKPLTLLGVVMDAPNLASALIASRPLITSAAHGFHVVTITAASQVVASYHSPWGAAADAVAPGGLSYLAWGGSAVTAATTAYAISPGTDPSNVGKLSAGPAAAPLVLDHPLTAPSILWRLTHPE